MLVGAAGRYHCKGSKFKVLAVAAGRYYCDHLGVKVVVVVAGRHYCDYLEGGRPGKEGATTASTEWGPSRLCTACHDSTAMRKAGASTLPPYSLN